MTRGFFAFCVVGLCLPSWSEAACTTTTADLTPAVIQAAINAAVDGDTICLPAGTGAWGTTGVSIPSNKGITLQGAGQGVTIIQNTNTISRAIDINVSGGHSVSRVTNLTIDANNVVKTGALGAWIAVIGTGVNVYRIDNVTLNNLKSRGIAMIGSILSGVVDHVTFNAPSVASVQGLSIYGAGAQVDTPFSSAYTPGTSNSTYIEDNIFNFSFPNDGAFDAYGGARIVFRYNTINGTFIGWHGADSGGYRGVHTVEAYRNTFNTTQSVARMMFFRSGSGVTFDNAYTGNYTNKIEMAVYRSRPNTFVAKYGQCDGLSAWDGNIGTGTLPTGNPGWPCLDQTGYTFTNASGGSYTWNPLYAWKNTLTGAEVNPQASLSEATGTATYVISDREWFHYSSIVNAGTPQTTGTRVGTLAQRPASCTTGVGYWANDQGTWNTGAGEDGVLYRCTATDTWTLYYTPYTYPHPLIPAASPPAPDPLTGTFSMAAFSGNTFAVFIWPRSTDAAHKQYNVYRCLTSAPCTALVYSVTPAQAASRLTTDTQFFDSSLYVSGTYYYSGSDVNTSDYVGPASTPVPISVTGKQ